MTDLEALWEAVRQNPHQDAPLNMLVDELIERGDDRTAAVLKWSSGLRWNVQLVKRPKPVRMAVEMLLGSIEDLPPFESVTEARAEVTVRDEGVPHLVELRDRLLIRSGRWAFLAVLESVERSWNSLDLSNYPEHRLTAVSLPATLPQ